MDPHETHLGFGKAVRVAKPLSLRQSLLRNLIAVILLFGGTILLTTYYASRQRLAELSRILTSQALDKTEQRLDAFFDPVFNSLVLMRDWHLIEELSLDEPDTINNLLFPILRERQQISSLLVADGRGREHMLLRLDDGYRNRQTRRDTWGNRTLWLEWDVKGEERDRRWVDLDYDPRERPWFRGPVAAGIVTKGESRAAFRERVHWTRPYTFFTTKEPGITASVLLNNVEEPRVIGLDVLLSDISRYTTQLNVIEAGKVVVLTDDGRVVGLPSDPRFADPANHGDYLLKHPEELGLPVITKASTLFGEQPSASQGPIHFSVNGETWWGEIRPFQLGRDRKLWVAVLIPENSLIGGIQAIRIWILVITVVILAGGVLRSAMLARRFSKPIEALVAQADRMREGDLEPGEPVSSHFAEVEQLAEANERMRIGLRSLVKLQRDLEIARQIQQSTFPDRLPQLPGFDLAVYSEPAEETAGDTYDVIGLGRDGDGHPILGVERVEERVFFLLADATGHGIGPALSVTQVRAMLRMAVRLDASLAKIARFLNQQLWGDLPADRFITAWLGELDIQTGVLKSFSAGQGPLLHFQHGNQQVVEVKPDTPPFGILPTIKTTPTIVKLAKGDIFAVLSDGFYEAEAPDGAFYGETAIVDLIKHHHGENCEQMLSAIHGEIEIFTAGAKPDDDRTAILIKRQT